MAADSYLTPDEMDDAAEEIDGVAACVWSPTTSSLLRRGASSLRWQANRDRRHPMERGAAPGTPPSGPTAGKPVKGDKVVPLDWTQDAEDWVCQMHGVVSCSQEWECVVAYKVRFGRDPWPAL